MQRFAVSALIALSLLLEGCSSCRSSQPSPPPRILTFTTKWPVLSSPLGVDQLRQSLTSGRLRLDDVRFNHLSCDFLNDASASPLPTIGVNGAAGDPTRNFSYVLVRLVRSTSLTPCAPASHATPTEILIQSGRGIVEDRTSQDSEMWIAFGADRFTADYSELTLTTIDTQRRFVSGTFQMMATNHANPQDTRVLIVTGGAFDTPY